VWEFIIEKQNTGLIVLVVVLSLLVLGLGGFIVYDKAIIKSNNNNNSDMNSGSIQETNDKNSNNEKNNVFQYELPSNAKTYDVYVKSESCTAIPTDDSASKEYIINVNSSINNNNINYKYFTNANLEVEYFDGTVIKYKENTELLLNEVCNYKNYLLTSEGWEGYTLIKLIDSNGKIVYTNNGSFEYKDGKLYLKKFTIDSSDHNKGNYQELSVDLTNNFKENTTKSVDFNCNNSKTYEEQKIESYCEFGIQ